MKKTGQFPDFSLAGSDGKTYTLQDFKGSKVVFYFYPKDATPGCTIEAKEFRDALPEFEKRKVKVVGISADSIKSHCNFVEKQGLNFLLLSDPEKLLLKELDLWKEKSMYGKLFFGIQRSTYLIDEKGAILNVWEKVKPQGHAKEILNFEF